ncbi:MAG TPA: M23 family metallopeptidase [Chthoniobacterales bacterium]|nr:M23 family metallopeptidase [Chthoniobacterales bacterium]
MRRGFLAGAGFSFLLLARSFGQQVEVVRQSPPQPVAPPALSGVDEEVKERASEALPSAVHYNRPAAPMLTAEQMRKAGALARQKIENEKRLQADRAADAAKRFLAASQPPQDRRSRISEPALSHAINPRAETAFTKLANGFDFPIGKPDAQGYYKARGFRSHGHLGEDWDGIRGGDTDLGDPIYSIGNGVVVFARDCHMGWGNVVIIRHAFREDGVVKNIDSLYGHLNTILVQRGQAVSRGENIGTMGTAHGIYDAHLHFEIRKNLEIGMSRAAFARDLSNYYDPTQFILSHRQLPARGGYRIAMNTFTRDANIHWNERGNYSQSSSRGTSESATALRRALASQH